MRYDAIIIGGGAAGLAARRALCAPRAARRSPFWNAQAARGTQIALNRQRPLQFHQHTRRGAGGLLSADGAPLPRPLLPHYPAQQSAGSSSLQSGMPARRGRGRPRLSRPAIMASSVLDALRLSLAEAGGRGSDRLSMCVSLEKKKSEFLLTSADGRTARRVGEALLAAGSPAAPAIGRHRRRGRTPLSKFGHRPTDFYPPYCRRFRPLETEPVPALKGLRVRCQCVARWKGIRWPAASRGEVLFTEYGVSGIRRHAAVPAFARAEAAPLEVDFLCGVAPERPVPSARACCQCVGMEDFLNGIRAPGA